MAPSDDGGPRQRADDRLIDVLITRADKQEDRLERLQGNLRDIQDSLIRIDNALKTLADKLSSHEAEIVVVRNIVTTQKMLAGLRKILVSCLALLGLWWAMFEKLYLWLGPLLKTSAK